MLPTIIADNADLMAHLQAAHSESHITAGLNMKKGTIADMTILGITASFQVKQQVILSAAKTADVIL